MRGSGIDWDDLYCRLIGATGWTWDTIDRLTLPRVQVLFAHWLRHPPMAWQLDRLTAYLGLPPPAPPPMPAATAQDALRQAAAAGLPIAEGRPNDPMLDLLDL